MMLNSTIAFGVRYRLHIVPFAALLMGLMCGVSAGAHDFWVQPAEYWLQPQIASSMTLQVGHGPFRQRSPIPPSRITRFETIGPDGIAIDMRGTLHVGDTGDDGALKFSQPGAYVLVLETDNRAQSHLPAIRFNDYLKVEGLTPALEQRERLHQTDRDGSENYRRQAKAIVQIGPPDASSQIQVTRPLGLPLEIVPEANPYARPQPRALPIRVIYEGQSLEGALVKLTHLENDAVPLETHMTDRMGRATFVMPTEGSWLLNVIWTKPLPRSRETDFETIFSSLSFGFSATRP
jgi:uncharacterized GH25 family protein